MNQDILQRFPNQNIEERPTECVGESVSDIIGNLVGAPCDAGYSYAATLRVMNVQPTTGGSDPYSGVVGGVVYGGLATTKEPFDATTTSELYESNLANYPVPDEQSAQQYAQNGLVLLESYQDIVDFLAQGKGGVILPITWYASFMTPNADGTLPMPSGPTTSHCVAIYEATTYGLRAKVWLGPNYGVGGYCFIPEALFTSIFVEGEAWGFDKTQSRWFNLATVALRASFTGNLQLLKDCVQFL